MRTKVPGSILLLGGVLALLGTFGGVAAFLTAISPAGDPWQTPGAVDLRLSPGRWVLYQQASPGQSQPMIPPRQVAVLGPAGPLELDCISCGSATQSMTLGDARYLGVVAFDTPQTATYRITVTTPGQTVLVSPSLWRSLAALFGGLGLTLLGVGLALVGLVWLVVGGITARHAAT